MIKTGKLFPNREKGSTTNNKILDRTYIVAVFIFFVIHKVDGKICSSLVIKNYPICSACFVIYHFFCSVRIDSEENKPTDKN